MALIDIEFAKTMTEIEDETILNFYINAVIKKIERIIGCSLEQEEKTEKIEGYNTENIWLIRKPLISVSEVKINDDVIDSENYEIINNTKPYIILKNNVACIYSDIRITNVSGYTSYDGDYPLDEDVQLLIFSTIKKHSENLEYSGLTSYKISDIAYSFSSYINQNEEFINEINQIFGVI